MHVDIIYLACMGQKYATIVFIFIVWLIYLKLINFPEGIMGMAIVGGAALAIGGLVTLGIALTKKWWHARNRIQCIYRDQDEIDVVLVPVDLFNEVKLLWFLKNCLSIALVIEYDFYVTPYVNVYFYVTRENRCFDWRCFMW